MTPQEAAEKVNFTGDYLSTYMDTDCVLTVVDVVVVQGEIPTPFCFLDAYEKGPSLRVLPTITTVEVESTSNFQRERRRALENTRTTRQSSPNLATIWDSEVVASRVNVQIGKAANPIGHI
jgi:hypothetical protein